MRALPSLQDARREHDPKYLTCDTCMQNLPLETRRTMACGYIPRDQHAPGMRFTPDTFSVEEAEAATCAGYTTALPEVIDIASNYHHWESGQLIMACDGEQPPRSLIAGMTVLKGAIGELEAKKMRDANEARGR